MSAMKPALCVLLLAGPLAMSARAAPLTLSNTEAVSRCQALAPLAGRALGEPSARISSASLHEASAPRVDPNAPPWAGPLPGMPQHCEVLGTMRERTGSDGQHYVVKYRLRLPTKWNGRFVFEGGGGTNGMLGGATGTVQPGMPTALDQGFAVVATDTGHDNATNSNPQRQGQVAFGHDYQARLEYAERALDSVATAGKRIVQQFYGRPADKDYFVGCSNGGREGMVFAQRFPKQFDGIVAGAPAFAVPKAAIAEAWDTQTFAALAKSQGQLRPDGLPDLVRAFSDADLGLVAAAVRASCDAGDGIEDGMVQDVLACTSARVKPALQARVCSGEKTASCLNRAQVDALEKSLAGPRDSRGNALYSDWPWDVGIADNGWRMWKLGLPGAMDAINVMLGSPALSGLFVTPPDTVGGSPEDGLRYQLQFDFDRDAPRIFNRTKQFPRSGWDLVGAQSTNLSAFRRAGGKMIVPHGGSDPIFSVKDTVGWWRKVDAANAGKANDFVRVFPVPGMGHCVGGPATERYDALTALVQWVEEGKAPERIEATAGPATPWPGRTRPLCPYPAVAHYTSGDVEKAASFACRQP